MRVSTIHFFHRTKFSSILILAIFLFGFFDFIVIRIALPLAIMFDRIADRKLESLKLFDRRIPDILGLLKDKPGLLILVSVQFHQLGTAVIGSWDHFGDRCPVRIAGLKVATDQW